jgi:hypothetical protein
VSSVLPFVDCRSKEANIGSPNLPVNKGAKLVNASSSPNGTSTVSSFTIVSICSFQSIFRISSVDITKQRVKKMIRELIEIDQRQSIVIVKLTANIRKIVAIQPYNFKFLAGKFLAMNTTAITFTGDSCRRSSELKSGRKLVGTNVIVMRMKDKFWELLSLNAIRV